MYLKLNWHYLEVDSSRFISNVRQRFLRKYDLYPTFQKHSTGRIGPRKRKLIL